MAHKINYNNGKYAFASSEKEWHSGETNHHIHGREMTAEEIIRLAGLDYDVQKMPIVAKVPSGRFSMDVPVDGNFATVRTDTNQVLGIVGKKYQILQNKDAFKFFDSIVGEGEAMYHTAGALGNGEKIFITAKLPQKLVITPDDVTDQYLFLCNSHDGSGSLSAYFTPIRVVCNNTLRLSMKSNSYRINLRHTANIVKALEQAHELMGIVNREGQDFLEVCKTMTRVSVTDQQLRKFIELSLKPETEMITEDEFSKRFTNIADAAYEYALSDETQLMDTTRGTLYGAFQAVTGYYSNVKQYNSGEDKTKSLIYGAGYRASNQAYQMGVRALSNTNFLN
jgi:phage/plasmid-like protein (TIGR03299 family)